MTDQPEVTPARTRPAHRRSLLVGSVIGVVGLGLVVRILVDDRAAVADALSGPHSATPALLLAALATGLVAMTGIGLAWHSLLRGSGAHLSRRRALRSYFVGQLGKYVPGGAWAVIGRGEWARREGVPGPAAYNSVVLSMVSAYTAAAFVVAASVPASGLSDGDAGPYWLVVLLVPVGLLAMHPRAVEAVLVVLRRVTGRPLVLAAPPWRTTVLLAVRQVPSWLAIGAVNVLVAVGLGFSPDVLDVISATAVSWIVGFLAIGVPGGIGVREVVFVAVAASLSAGPAAAVALIARLVFVAVDLIGAVGFTVAAGVGRSDRVPA